MIKTLPLMHRQLEVRGRVIRGSGEGKQLGFPTANLSIDSTNLPLKLGVYAGFTTIFLPTSSIPTTFNHSSLIYFGPRLIHGETKNNFEVHLFDFAGDLYDHLLMVKVEYFLRAPLPFTSLPALKVQLAQDSARARQVLASRL